MQKETSDYHVSFFKKFIFCLFAFAGFPFLVALSALAFIDVNKADNVSEIQLLTNIINTSYLAFPIIIILSVVVWQIRDKRKPGNFSENKTIIYYCITLCRYVLAAIVMFYGFSKLMVDQLDMPYYWYGDELGKLSGLQLTWSFFGYSKIYSTSIAAAQIIGGFLLLFRRTTFFATLCLLPVLVNIALIDFNYDIPAKDIITVLLLITIFLFSLSGKPFFLFLFNHEIVDGKNIVNAYTNNKKAPGFFKPILVVAVTLFAILPNYHQMKPAANSPLQGAWEAHSVENFTDSIPEKNKKLTLRLFVDGKTVTVKKTYQYEDFSLKYDFPGKNHLALIKTSDSLHTNDIAGTYQLVSKDSLLFTGKDGKDSVHWVLTKFSH